MSSRFVWLLAVLLVADAYGRDKKLVESLNQDLGKIEREFRDQYGEDCRIEQPPNSLNNRVVFTMLPIMVHVPSVAASSTAETVGSIDKRGNIWAKTTTVEHPGSSGGILYMHVVVIYSLDANGRASRWEAYNWPTLTKEFSGYPTSDPHWRLIDGRELVTGRNGKSKIVKVEKNLPGFYWTP